MSGMMCKCGCGKRLHSRNKTGYAVGHGPKKKCKCGCGGTVRSDSRSEYRPKAESIPAQAEKGADLDVEAHDEPTALTTAIATAKLGNRASAPPVRCRVAMFEVEGSESALTAAIKAVKAALQRSARPVAVSVAV